MTAPPLLHILTDEGFICRAEGDQLIVHPAGDLTDAHRVMIRAAKPDLMAYLRHHPDYANSPIPPPPLREPCRFWLIRHLDGRLMAHTFTPPATEAEVCAWYPQALTIAADEQG